MTRPVLVAGGAGYIGSHVVRRLLAAGRDVVVLDDLSTASHHVAPSPRFYMGDLFDLRLVDSIIAEHGVDTIIHAAANHYPIRRMASAATAFTSLVKSGVSKLIFTSSCAVYGPSGARCLVDETCATNPLSCYGEDKLALERVLLNLSETAQLRCVVLRCFNVAGALRRNAFSGSVGDSSRLVNIACRVATGRSGSVPVFGSNFPTVDGTGERDYVHVDDVAKAFVRAASYLERGGGSVVLNCGTGNGHSVLEVVRAVERESGVAVPISVLPHKPEEVPCMVADIRKIRETLGWAPRFDSLSLIVRSALACARAG